MCPDTFEGTFCQYAIESLEREEGTFDFIENWSFDIEIPWKIIALYVFLITATIALVLISMWLFEEAKKHVEAN